MDNYFWLRDRTDPDVIAYLEAENRYTEAVMASTELLQETLYQEILGRIQETDLSVPVRRDDYFYYTRTEEGKAYGIYCRKHDGLDASEEILLDANVLAAGQNYFRLGNFVVSPRSSAARVFRRCRRRRGLHHFRERPRGRRAFTGSDCEHLLHVGVGQRQSNVLLHHA